MDSTLAAHTLGASTEIATAALSGDDPDAVLGLVVRRAAELAQADLGLVMARAADGSLTVEAAHGAPAATTVPDGFEPVGLVLSARSAAARVARSGVPVVVEDMVTDPSTAPFVPRELRRYGPFAAAPFGTRERRLGALTVYRRRGAAPFTPASMITNGRAEPTTSGRSSGARRSASAFLSIALGSPSPPAAFQRADRSSSRC